MAQSHRFKARCRRSGPPWLVPHRLARHGLVPHRLVPTCRARARLLDLSLGTFVFVFSAIPVWAADGPPPVRIRESVAVETNRTAERQFALARAHLQEKRWAEGIDLIRQVTANDSNSLVPLGPGRYVNAAIYSQLLLETLPPEGLAVARKAVDEQARQAYIEALRNRDDAALRTIVRDAFVSRAADDALMTLGQWAWEAGDVTQARANWERLIALPHQAAPGELAPVLRYPDTHHDRASILARLVTCSIVDGDAERAASERSAFRRLFPDARGDLGGLEGKLSDRLDQIALAARRWSFPPRDRSVSTFGVNAARNGVLPGEVDVGALRWSAEVASDPFSPGSMPSSKFRRESLCLFPVVFGNLLLVNTTDQILAWNIETGQPAWPVGHADNPVIYPPVPDPSSTIVSQQLVGAPQFTMTVSDGFLYARMGDPVAAHPRDEPRESMSFLVRLDLGHGQGKLGWKIPATALDPLAVFEGSPLVVNGRAYVAARKGRTLLQSEVACFDAETGRRLWDRPVCAAVANVGPYDSLISLQLLTFGDEAVYLSTGNGAIAAVEADGSALRWVVTYESAGQDQTSSVRARHGSSACLFAQNTVVAAPLDFDGLLAIDSRTGTTLWQRSLPGHIDHLLGAKNGLLYVSGDGLWGLDLADGRVAWHVGFTDPASFGFGRGILAGDVIYWPTRDEIIVVEQASGALRRRIALTARYAETAGNLLLAGDSLIVAGPGRIAVFSPDARRPQRKTDVYSRVAPGADRGLARRGEPALESGLFGIATRR